MINPGHKCYYQILTWESKARLQIKKLRFGFPIPFLADDLPSWKAIIDTALLLKP